MAYREDIRSVCETMLDLAGPLPKVQLAELVSRRFNVPFIERLGYLADGEGDDVLPVSAEDPTDMLHERAAQWMLHQLSDEERRIIALRLQDEGIRGVAESLKLTKYMADLLIKRVEKKMRLLADIVGDDALIATRRLMELIGQWDDLRHSTDGDDEGNDD
jgi:hypothetical protein